MSLRSRLIRVAHAHPEHREKIISILNRNAGRFSVFARLGTSRWGRNPQQELWLYTTIPGGNTVAWDSLEDGRLSLSVALENFKKALKNEGAKVGYAGRPFLTGNTSRLELAVRVDQAPVRDPEPIHTAVNNALWSAGIEQGR